MRSKKGACVWKSNRAISSLNRQQRMLSNGLPNDMPAMLTLDFMSRSA